PEGRPKHHRHPGRRPHRPRDERRPRAGAGGGLRGLHRQADRHPDVRGPGKAVPRPAGVPAARPRGQRPAGGSLKRILVADDDPASAELLTYFLESKGFEVATALDGNRALEMGTSGNFQLVILDVHMPMYDGVEILQFLRKRHMLHPIKVIALTGDLS